MDMPKCETCGTAIPPDAPLGHCPACLMDCAEHFGGSPETESTAQELPRQFGDYELLRQIGCGGMGLVYEARHTRLRRRVALKMIRPDLASRKFLRRFLIEGEAAARLDHPNIIPIYEIKEDGVESFFSMQFIEGESLKERIRKGEYGFRDSKRDLTASEAHCKQQAIARLMSQLCRGVHHAHERGVFHRDLKPGNILLDSAGRPHIADFGVAKIVRDEEHADAESALTVPGATLGTPEYMAPEQASGASVGERPMIAAADIYSLGAILYELLIGRPPFRGSSNLETLQKVRKADLKRPRSFNPAVARDLETICLKCMEKNPQARYTSADAIADDLDRWLNGEPIVARPISLPVRAQRWAKGNPVGIALIISLFFGLGISLGFITVFADRMGIAEENKALERETYLQKYSDLWALPTAPSILIPSSLLADFRDQKPRPFVEGRDVRLKFGMNVDTDPITKAYSVAPLLGALESRMGQSLGKNVFIDLHISKASHLESQLLFTHDADLQRVDALSYIEAKARDPGIVPLLIENDADEMVFCALQDSGITNLRQLAGKAVGLGDSNSAASVLARYSLLTNGIRKVDLKSIAYFTNLAVVNTRHLPEAGSTEIMTDMREVKSGREALRHLLRGHVDVAVTPKRYFEIRRHRGTGLRLIHKFPGVPEVFAARSGLDPKVLNAFQEAMLSLKKAQGVGTLGSFRIVTGVVATNDSYFDGLRMAVTNVQHHFESTDVLSSRGLDSVQH